MCPSRVTAGVKHKHFIGAQWEYMELSNYCWGFPTLTATFQSEITLDGIHPIHWTWKWFTFFSALSEIFCWSKTFLFVSNLSPKNSFNSCHPSKSNFLVCKATSEHCFRCEITCVAFRKLLNLKYFENKVSWSGFEWGNHFWHSLGSYGPHENRGEFHSF